MMNRRVLLLAAGSIPAGALVASAGMMKEISAPAKLVELAVSKGGPHSGLISRTDPESVISKMTEYVAKGISKTMGNPPMMSWGFSAITPPQNRTFKLGSRVRDRNGGELVLNRVRNASIRIPCINFSEPIENDYLDAVVKQLSSTLAALEAVGTAEIRLPEMCKACCFADNGVIVRGVLDYSIAEDAMWARFDVLFAGAKAEHFISDSSYIYFVSP